MIIIFLLTFATVLGTIAFLGAKLGKAARKARMRQDIELYRKIMSERGNDN